MGLCNVYSYLNEYNIGKTVKLSDSYQVRIRLNDEDFAEGTSNHTKSKYSDSRSSLRISLPVPVLSRNLSSDRSPHRLSNVNCQCNKALFQALKITWLSL